MPVEAGRHMDDLLQALRAEALGRGLHGALCVVAVSGGPDSVALWHLLGKVAPELSMRLHLCHVDHAWRPDAAERESRICAHLADATGAGYTVVHLPAPRRRSEEEARDLRLGLLRRVAAGLGASAVALGHQQDDQAETVLMQLVRGSARAAGMPAWRQPFWRPLLAVPKERLLDVCSAAGLAYSVDETNLSEENLRARLRAGALPLLRRENPRVAEAIARNASLRAEDDQWLNEEAQAWLLQLQALPGGIDLRALRGAPTPVGRRALRALLERRGVSLPLARTEEIWHALRTGGRLSPAPGLRLEGGALWWGQDRPEAVALCDGARARFGDMWVGLGDPPQDALTAPAPAGEVWVRGRRPGDRLHTAAGTRKLQDIFVDAKVPRSLRDLIPIFMNGAVPFWVPGKPSADIAAPVRTAWAAPAPVVASLWSVLK